MKSMNKKRSVSRSILNYLSENWTREEGESSGEGQKTWKKVHKHSVGHLSEVKARSPGLYDGRELLSSRFQEVNLMLKPERFDPL
jgi:hypothetical protein